MLDRIPRSGSRRITNGNVSSWMDNGDIETSPSSLQNIGLEALSAAASADSRSYTGFSGSSEHPSALPVAPSQIPQSMLPRTPSRETRGVNGRSSRRTIPAAARRIASPQNQANPDVGTPIDPSLDSSYSPGQRVRPISTLYSSKSRVLTAESSHEIAFLLRHYAEVLGVS